MGAHVSSAREKFLTDHIDKFLDSRYYNSGELISAPVFTGNFIVYLNKIGASDKIPQLYLSDEGALMQHIFQYFWDKKMIENMCIKIPIEPGRGKFLSHWVHTVLPQFLDSEYCEIVEGKFMSLSLFTLAFLVYAKNRLDITIPRELLIPCDLESHLHLYFHEVERENVYIDGVMNDKILVGVSVLKWTAIPRKLTI